MHDSDLQFAIRLKVIGRSNLDICSDSRIALTAPLISSSFLRDIVVSFRNNPIVHLVEEYVEQDRVYVAGAIVLFKAKAIVAGVSKIIGVSLVTLFILLHCE